MTIRRLGVIGTIGALVLALGMQFAAAAATPLLGNGSFEVPAVPVASFANFPTGSTLGTCGLAMPGSIGYQFGCWRVFGGNVDVVNTKYWKAAGHTQQSIELNGTTPGRILQAFVAKPDYQYNINFKLSGDPTVAGTVTMLLVQEQFDSGGNYLGGGPIGTYTFDTSTNSTTDMGYVKKTGSFQTGSTTAYADIEFQSLTQNNDALSWGPVVDEVTMHAKALPPT